MQKTVNQWLDFLDALPEIQRKNKDIESFQNQLINIKMDNKYKGYGGIVNIILLENLKSLLTKFESK